MMGPCVLSEPREHEGNLRAVDRIFHLRAQGVGAECSTLNVGLWIDERVTGEIIAGAVYWTTANVSVCHMCLRRLC
jgi:hypothetical protein